MGRISGCGQKADHHQAHIAVLFSSQSASRGNDNIANNYSSIQSQRKGVPKDTPFLHSNRSDNSGVSD
jgi:hypothetical protein